MGDEHVALNGIPMVLIYVTDVEASVRWYVETLGLSVLYQDQGFASLGVGRQRIGLHAAEAIQPDGPQTMPVFGVGDYADAKQQLEAKGCEFYFENETPNAIFGSFRDLEGNPLQIIQDTN